MKKFLKYFAFVFLLITCYNYSQGGWVLQSQIGGNDIDFVNLNTGYKINFGDISKTTNSGDNWFIQYTISNGTLYSIDVQDTLNIAAVGYRGIIIRTSNSSQTWIKDSIGRASTFYKVLYLTNDLLFVCGSTSDNSGDGLVMKSTNGGLNWNEQIYPHALGSELFLGLFFTNEYTGYIVDYVFQVPSTGLTRILKTSNGGLNWSEKHIFPGKNLKDIYFINSNTGYVYGSKALYYTSDAGENWIERTGTLYNIYMENIIFANFSTGYIAGTVNGNAVIFKTTNDGLIWNQQLYIQGSTNACNRICLTDDLTGWACCYSGIYKTTNGGEPVGIQTFSTEIPEKFSLSQNYLNPFNPQTKIRFDIPANVRGKTSNVKLIIYDMLGREVTTLVNEELKPGTYEADWDGSNYSSGVYFYKIISNEFTETRKMVLMK